MLNAVKHLAPGDGSDIQENQILRYAQDDDR